MKKSPKYKLRRIGRKAMIVAISDSEVNLAEVHTLNETAADIWQHLPDGEIDPQALADWVCSEYDIDRATALSDINKQLEQWHTLGLLD